MEALCSPVLALSQPLDFEWLVVMKSLKEMDLLKLYPWLGFGHLMVDTGTFPCQMEMVIFGAATCVQDQLCTQPLKLSLLISEFINQSDNMILKLVTMNSSFPIKSDSDDSVRHTHIKTHISLLIHIR